MYIENTEHMALVAETVKFNFPQALAGQAAKCCFMLQLKHGNNNIFIVSL